MISYSQGQVFLFFFIIGIILGVVFDFFRALRRCLKTSDIATFIEDILFIIISIILISLGIIKLNHGIVRFFLFIGLFCGIMIYSLTISNLCVIIFSVFVKICKNILLSITKTIFIGASGLKKLIKKDF